MKITIIGAGSTYTPELIEGILRYRENLDVHELSLMDIDERKLRIVGGLAQRMVAASPMRCEVKLTMELDDALRGADFVLAQIRVGKLPARRLDETIPPKYGMLGQETMGMGGFFKAQRTIPQLMHIARRMSELCPDAFLINFSNPSGLVAQALLNHTGVRMLGLCNVPFNMRKSLTEKLSLSQDAFIEFVGLNHLCWITAIRDGETDRLDDAIAQGVAVDPMKNIPAQGFSRQLMQAIHAIPSSYLEYVYYLDSKIEKNCAAEHCRAERCMEIEEELLAMYENAELHEKPKLLESRGGANYSLCAISLVNAIYNDLHEIHVVNTQNRGALSFLADGDVIEVASVIGRNGASPIPVKTELAPHIETLVRHWKAYEKYAVQAALTGDRDAVAAALLTCPVIGNYDKAMPCFEEMAKAHAAYLPQFAR